MLTRNGFKKIEKWTSFGALIVTSLFATVALGGIVYLYLLFVMQGVSTGVDKTDLASSIRGDKRQELLKFLDDRAKKKDEALSPFSGSSDGNQNKKDPFNLP